MTRCLQRFDRVRHVVTLVAAIGWTAGCSAPMQQHFDDLPNLRVQTQWQTRLDFPGPVAYYPKQFAIPAVSRKGRTVIAGSERGTLVAVDSRNGRDVWRYKTYGKIRSAPTISGGAVYFGATDGKVYRLNLRTGKLDWNEPYATKGAVTSAPTVVAGKVLFQNNENRTYAVDAKTGQYLWDQGRPRVAALTVKGEGGVSVADGVVYAGYDDGFLAAMRLDDGATVWSKNLAGKAKQFVDVDTRPMVIGDAVYASSFSAGLYCIGRKHGDIRWLYPARGVLTPAVGDNALYVASTGGNVVALRPKNGEVLWRAQFSYGDLASPVFDDGRLWVTTGDGLLLMDALAGRTLARITPHNGLAASVAAKAGKVYMVTNSGALVGARIL